MAQSKRTLGEVSRLRARKGPPHRVLCVLPRRLSANPLRKLLQDFELAAADSATAALRHARETAYDLYVVYSPLGWEDATLVCRRLREFDAQTPMILYSVQPTALERRAALAQRAIHAYVADSEDAHNLAATAGQLIMLAELRSMEALRARMDGLQAHVDGRVARFARASATLHDATDIRAVARLKAETCRLFTAAGGSRANFERLWPALYDAALKRRIDGR